MMAPPEKKVSLMIRGAGYLLVALSLAYLAYKLSQIGLMGLSQFLNGKALAVLSGLVILYSLMNLLLASNWMRLVRMLSRDAAVPKPLYRIYLQSVTAKYLPGNIFHIAGRHLLARDLPVPQATLLRANAAEILFIMSAAGLILLATLGESTPAVIRYMRDRAGLLKTGALILIPLAGILLYGFRHTVKREAGIFFGRGNRMDLMLSMAFYGLFFLFTSLILKGVLWLQIPAGFSAPASSLNLLHAFTLAWMAGFVIPGAPGGMGVREALLLLMLAPFCGEPAALASSLLLRVITVLGDVLAFFYSLVLQRREKKIL